jgi:hypothetical protein
MENKAYVEGWNAAIDAACEALRKHRIAWMSDKTFSHMEWEIQQAVAKLRKEEAGD